MKVLHSIALILLSHLIFNQATGAEYTIHVETIPANTPATDNIYIAGTLNGWDAGNPDYILTEVEGEYWITLDIAEGPIEFKFTRGSWQTGEGTAQGGYIGNRTATVVDNDTLHCDIAGWEDVSNAVSTANDQVQVWDEDMYIPQLDRYRRVWVYLPQDYDDSPNKHYKVLYVLDGQNAFDAATSYSGEWEIDEALTEMENQGRETAIVIAVDNGLNHRTDEYSPWTSSFGGGEGEEFLAFLTETLKPRVDSTFRTLNGPENTGIMGSSMGGLFSHYAHFERPDIFGIAGIFSPCYGPFQEVYSYTADLLKANVVRLYMIAGSEESADFNEASVIMNNQLIGQGYTSDELYHEIITGGTHSEWFWDQEFEAAFTWLFENETATPVYDLPNLNIEINVWPLQNNIEIKGQGEYDVRIYDVKGYLLHNQSVHETANVEMSKLGKNQVVLIAVSQNGLSTVKKVVLP